AVEGGAAAIHAVVRLGDAAGGVAGGQRHAHRTDVPAVVAQGSSQAVCGAGGHAVDLEAIGVGALGVAPIVHAVEGDTVAAVAAAGDGAAVEGGAAAVHAVVRLIDAAGGVAGGQGHVHRTADVPAVAAHGTGETVRGRRGHAVNPEAVRPISFHVAGVIDAVEGDAVAAVAGDGEGAAVEGGAAAVHNVIGLGDAAGVVA